MSGPGDVTAQTNSPPKRELTFQWRWTDGHKTRREAGGVLSKSDDAECGRKIKAGTGRGPRDKRRCHSQESGRRTFTGEGDV